MAKKRLLVVVGAGASIEFGMPGVADVGEIISHAIQGLYPLASDPHSNLYDHIQGLIRTYWTSHVRAALYRDPNFEDVLYSIFALSAAYPAGIHTSALGALIAPRVLPDVVEFGRNVKSVSRHELRHLAAHAADAIVAEFRDRCRVLATNKAAELSRLEGFMSALQEKFDIAVVTLNYDDVVYRVLPGIETGFDPTSGEFQDERILSRSAWPCMLHLHGSVHFDMPLPRAGGHDLHEIRWQKDLAGAFAQNAFGRGAQASREGANFPTSVVVAGYGKTTQILRRPFRTYYSELDRLVSTCDAVLFAGYGFADEHLNGAFKRLRDDNRRRPVVIVSYAPPGTMTLCGADPDNHLTDAVVQVLHTDLKSMTWLGFSHPGVVDELLDKDEFEISANSATPLSVWYKGMLAACDNAAKVMAKLA